MQISKQQTTWIAVRFIGLVYAYYWFVNIMQMIPSISWHLRYAFTSHTAFPLFLKILAMTVFGQSYYILPAIYFLFFGKFIWKWMYKKVSDGLIDNNKTIAALLIAILATIVSLKALGTIIVAIYTSFVYISHFDNPFYSAIIYARPIAYSVFNILIACLLVFKSDITINYLTSRKKLNKNDISDRQQMSWIIVKLIGLICLYYLAFTILTAGINFITPSMTTHPVGYSKLSIAALLSGILSSKWLYIAIAIYCLCFGDGLCKLIYKRIKDESIDSKTTFAYLLLSLAGILIAIEAVIPILKITYYLLHIIILKDFFHLMIRWYYSLFFYALLYGIVGWYLLFKGKAIIKLMKSRCPQETQPIKEE